MNWKSWSGNFTTTKTFRLTFDFHNLVQKIVMSKFYMDESTESRYDIILGGYLITVLVTGI